MTRKIPMHDGKVDIKSFDLAGLVSWFEHDLRETPGRARRAYKALWQDGVTDFAAMEGVTRPVRKRLAEVAVIRTLALDRKLVSNDGTTKYLWKLFDGSFVESVYIPDDDRVTLCVSSQVGCAMACTFCLTGDLGLKRHLVASEIASQVAQVRQDALAQGLPDLTNLVFMGMGEPLHNLPNLLPALRTCLDDDALGFSHRRVTVSTVGLVPKLGELAAALPVNLAVSLNATTEEQRRSIMPITRKHSMQELLDACRTFPLPRTKRIAFEYVMFAGFNDSLADAERLLGLLDGIRAKVNLIPYNENPDRPALKRPSEEVVRAFQDLLVNRGMTCTVRTTRGLDISAACGQLGKASAA
jgi:23S rRNA (adenine2503-C2)-methyltransferase